MKVIKFFTDNTSYSESDIDEVKKITNGFSDNDNYLVTLKNKDKFQVRLPIQKIDHSNERKIADLYKESNIIFIDQEGNMIRKWIEGEVSDFSNPTHAHYVLQAIKDFQQIPHNNQFDDYGLHVYEEHYSKLSPELLNEFKETAKELEQEPKSLTHGDINSLNVVVSKEKAHLIDFEWVRFGPSIGDYASLIAFSNIDINIVSEFTGYSKEKLIKYARLSLIHATLWAHATNTEKSKIYLVDVLKKLETI